MYSPISGGLRPELERFKQFLTDLLHDPELYKAGERGCLLSVIPSLARYILLTL